MLEIISTLSGLALVVAVLVQPYAIRRKIVADGTFRHHGKDYLVIPDDDDGPIDPPKRKDSVPVGNNWEIL